jgi:hypothetical protein
MPAPVRISGLPVITSLSGNERLPIVQLQNNELITAQVSLSTIETRILADVSVLASAAFQPYLEDLEEIKTSIVGLMAQAAGVVTLTDVAGVLDGNGRCANYTANSPVTPTANMLFAFVPHAPSAITPTLSINGGPARAIRANNDTVLSANALRTNTWITLRFSASNRFLKDGDDVLYAAGAEYRSDGTMNFGSFVSSETVPRAQWQHFTDGSKRLRLGGDGINTPANIIDFEDNGDIRMRAGTVRDIQGNPVYTLSNPPPFEVEHKEYVEKWAGLPGRRHENSGRGTFVNWSEPWCLTGNDDGTMTTINNASGFIDLSGVQPETVMRLETTSTGGCTIWAGSLGATFVGGGDTRGMSANSLVEIVRGRDTLRAIALDGTLSTPALSLPSYARTMVVMGQSWALRGSRSMVSGMQRRYGLMALGRSVYSIHDAAVGASSFVEGGATVPTNFWWDQSTGTPGPNAIIARDKILASGRTPSFGAFIIGGNDYPALLPNVGGVTPAQWADYFRDFRDWLATEISNSTFTIFICPMGAQEPSGQIDESAIYALRYAQLEACTLSSYIRRGPDWYDIPRYDGIHLTWFGGAVHGERLAAFQANALESKNELRGPKITSFSRVAAKEYNFVINRADGLLSGTPFFRRPPNPIGFAVLAGGDLYGTPLTITDTAWSGDTLRVFTATDDVSAIGAYPYGNFDIAKEENRIVATYDAATERYLPLQTYHPDAAI